MYTQPTFEQFKQGGLAGKMFYEVHPQLWGQGIMSEAFVEVLRFAMEEIGCTAVQVSNRLRIPKKKKKKKDERCQLNEHS